jgi:hypothetical protein
MGTVGTALRAFSFAAGLRRTVSRPWHLEDALRTVGDEAGRREERFLRSLDALVWPYAASPTRRLLAAAGLEPVDVRRLVDASGLDAALGALRDHGVYVSYEEYQGRAEARRGSATFSFSPPDFFNPVVRGDYMATTGGSRSLGTPVELSWAWQRYQGVKTPIQRQLTGLGDGPAAVWLPVFPSAAGFGAVVKTAAGGTVPERWFSQIPVDVQGIAGHKQLANRAIPALAALTRTGLPSPEHVPTDDPEPVVRWLEGAVARAGRALIAGYASSITAAARWAVDHGVDLTGVVAHPASEPVTAGKLAAIRAAGMRPYPGYAFVPEGVVASTCDACQEEEYHLWDHEVAVTTRRRQRADGSDVDAFLWTSLSAEAPRVLVNVENDDYGVVRHGVACDCDYGQLGLHTRVADIRGISKVVAAGISLDGETFDRLVEVDLPARLGGGPGDYQFVEEEHPSGTVVSLRVHPRLGPVDGPAALDTVRRALHATENGVLADEVWSPGGGLRIVRAPAASTRAGKTLSYERIGAATPPVALEQIP